MFRIASSLPAALAIICALSIAQAETSAIGPEKDTQIKALLGEARDLIDHKKFAEAVEKCDQAIKSYEEFYQDSKVKVHCAQSGPETLAYLAQATAVDKTSSIVISSVWADAYFMKGYVLKDLQRIPEAKDSLQHAVDLSPFNSQYLSELGSLYQLEKNWVRAKELFKKAEDSAGISSEESKARELGRARRSYAYCLMEEGQLDEAENIYRECLKTDPNDAKARNELQYIQKLRLKINKLPENLPSN